MTLVFVYGTLRAGERNHHFLSGARMVRRALTAPCYTMIDLGCFPAIVEGGRTAIVGEVYPVDDETLERIDHLEGHPRFYERRNVVIARGPRDVAAYFLPRARPGAPTIVSGDWRTHRVDRETARDPLAAALDDLAYGRPTPRALAALSTTSRNRARTPKPRC